MLSRPLCKKLRSIAFSYAIFQVSVSKEWLKNKTQKIKSFMSPLRSNRRRDWRQVSPVFKSACITRHCFIRIVIIFELVYMEKAFYTKNPRHKVLFLIIPIEKAEFFLKSYWKFLVYLAQIILPLVSNSNVITQICTHTHLYNVEEPYSDHRKRHKHMTSKKQNPFSSRILYFTECTVNLLSDKILSICTYAIKINQFIFKKNTLETKESFSEEFLKESVSMGESISFLERERSVFFFRLDEVKVRHNLFIS